MKPLMDLLLDLIKSKEIKLEVKNYNTMYIFKLIVEKEKENILNLLYEYVNDIKLYIIDNKYIIYFNCQPNYKICDYLLINKEINLLDDMFSEIKLT
jgi:hypothetical protein